MTESTFENEQISLQVVRQPESLVELKATTKAKAIETARVAAAKKVSKEVSLPGFRKGKAPEDLIIKQYGHLIEREFRDILARNVLNDSITLSGLRPFETTTQINLTRMDENEDKQFEITFSFEAYPDVPKIDPSELTLTEISPKEVLPEEIEKKIEELKLYHAEWEEISDRGAEPEDYVVLDIDLVDEEPAQRIHENSRFHLKDGKMPVWAQNLVKGLKPQESAEGMSEPEGDKQEESFKPRKCKITLQRIQKAKLPELDDALAKKAGVETVELLHEAIKKSLIRESEKIAQHQKRKAMEELILSKYSVDLPRSRREAIHTECHQIASNEKAHFSSHEQEHAYAHELQNEALQSLTLSFLIPQVLRDHHLSAPTPQEIQHRMTEKMIMRMMSGQNTQDIDHERLARHCENEMIMERGLDFLIDNAKKA